MASTTVNHQCGLKYLLIFVMILTTFNCVFEWNWGGPRQIPRGGPNSRLFSTDVTENTVALPKDSPKEPKDSPADLRKDLPKDSPVDLPKDSPVDLPKDSPVDLKDSPVDLRKDLRKDSPVDLRKDLPKDSPGDLKDSPVDLRKDLPKDSPVDLKDSPVDLRKDLPKGLSNDLPKDVPKDFPKDVPKDIPKYLPKDLHVELEITQTMGLALIDGYRMHLICSNSKSSNDAIAYVDMSWSSMGLRSLWVKQSDAERQDDYIERKLFFEPWLDQHAGEYTCHLTVKVNNSHTVTVNKTYILSDEFRGMLNSRNTTKKFDISPVKSSKWFSNANLCVQDDIWQNYTEFHASVLSGKQKGKYLIYDCAVMGESCGGYGNRIHGVTVMFMFAMLTKRVFLLQMTNPVNINTYLVPGAIQWNHSPPMGLKLLEVDLVDEGNFYANYKPLETELLDNDIYDVIRVRINFGLFYYLVTMNDIMLNNLISKFNLKTQYDVVMLYGCAFNYLFKYQPRVIQGIDSLQTELGLETGKFVALHIRSHINDNFVFNPLNLEFPFKLMFECAIMAAKSLRDKLNLSKVPIYFTTDHDSIIEYAKQKYGNMLVYSRSPIFHVDRTKYIGTGASNQYNSGMIGVLSDIEICSRAAVLVRSADSSFSELMGAIHFLRPQYNLHPFYFYENLSLCHV